MRLRESLPGQWNFSMRWYVGSERVILRPTHPPNPLAYIPLVKWHIMHQQWLKTQRKQE